MRYSIAAIVLMVGVAVALAAASVREEHDPGRTQHVSVQGLYVTDLRDARRLVGAADDVFLAEVRGRSRTSVGGGADPRPRTFYEVHVLDVIKGDVSGDIEVGQAGGPDATGTEIRYSDEPPLANGKTYFLLTTDALEGGRNIIPGFGIIDADTDDRREKAQRLLAAGKAQQIPYRRPGGS